MGMSPRHAHGRAGPGFSEPTSGGGTGDPWAALRRAANQLRAVAEDLEGLLGSPRPWEATDPTARNVVSDAVTHVRLTAEALDFLAS